MAGLIHIYCGDGKGKTTAAVGLTVRAAGAGKKVVFTQFFKGESSSEIKILKSVENIKTMHCQTVPGLYYYMDDKQKEQAKADYTKLLLRALEEARTADLLVLDEAISACNYGTIPEQTIVDFLNSRPENLEVVLTGRNPSQQLQDLADYVTEMRKIKHPYDRGVLARKGIEF